MEEVEGRLPTTEIEDEHRVIEKVVKAMAIIADRLDSGQEIDPSSLKDTVEFMRLYADSLHHGKEETHMFPFLEERGVPTTGCPLGALIAEHERGRKLVGQLSDTATAFEQGDPAARTGLVVVLRLLVDLYPAHIWKEDYLLLPMSEKLLKEGELKELGEKFKTVEQEIGEPEIARLERLAERLENV